MNCVNHPKWIFLKKLCCWRQRSWKFYWTWLWRRNIWWLDCTWNYNGRRLHGSQWNTAQEQRFEQARNITLVERAEQTFFVGPCGHSWKNKSGSTRHRCKQTPAIFLPCQQCGKICKIAGSLQRHVNTKHHKPVQYNPLRFSVFLLPTVPKNISVVPSPVPCSNTRLFWIPPYMWKEIKD